MKNRKTAVIIVTYNSEAYIEACIDSVLQNASPVEIVVVDNNSQDGTLPILKKYKQINIILNDKNVGFAAAVNQGIKYGMKKDCQCFLLLNPDTTVDKTLIDDLITPFEDPKIGVTGPVITYENKQDTIWFAGGIFNKTFCYTRHEFMDKKLHEVKSKSHPVDFITGACMMVRKEVIENVGYLPEEYFLYFEDAFYCQKVRAAGFQCYFVGKPLVRHRVSSSTGQVNSNKMTPLRSYYFARNPLLYIRKEVHGWRKITNYLGQFIIRLPRYMIKNIIDGNMVGIASYVKGLIDGFRTLDTL